MVGSTPRLSLRRRPVHAMQEGARDEHRSDAHEEAEDPADLGPGSTAREENG